MTFFLRFHKIRGGGADGRVSLEFLELIRSQNCKIPPTHELKKKRDCNGKLLTGWGKIRTVKTPTSDSKMLPSGGDLYHKDLPVGK